MERAPPIGWKVRPPPPSQASIIKLQSIGRGKPTSRRILLQRNATISETNDQVATTVGPDSTRLICKNCSSEINTVTDVRPGHVAYMCGALLFVLGFVCGCCLIPCCVDTCMDVHHKCPECGFHLGRYERIRDKNSNFKRTVS